MRHSGYNQNRIADPDVQAGFTKAHDSITLRYVIQLFANLVPVQLRFLTRLNDRLGQTLSGIAVNGRMHQFADFLAVLGDVGRDGPLAGFHAFTHNTSNHDSRRLIRT